MIYNPHNYQAKAGQFIREKDFSGLFLDMGLGKTVITLTELDWLMYQDVSVKKVLVVGPKQVVRSVWKQEAQKWDHLKHMKISVVWGRNERERLKALHEEADVYLINREMLVWLADYYKSAWPFDMVVVDESSSFKNHGSQRFRALKMMRPYITRMVLLTGTPAPNGLLDLWSQIFLLDRGERLEKNVTGYRNRYFVAQSLGDGFISKYVPRPEAANAIYSKISDICISMKSEDYLDLPPIIHNDIMLDMDPDVKQMYNKFKEEQILQLKNTEITALNAGALTNKLLQYTNGAVYHSDTLPGEKKQHTVVHDMKIEALADIMEEAQGNPVLVFYTFQHDADRIRAKFPKVRTLKTPKDIEDWNAGKIDMLMAHPASAGHGLNLQEGGHIMVWFGLNWSLELYLQALKRLYRQGQTKSVIMHRILIRGTMDMRVSKALENKENGQNELLLAVKAEVDEVMYRHRAA